MAASNGVYSDRGSSAVEADYASGVGGFFSSDSRKHEDLKNMLDSSKDGLKLEAMKRIIGMIAKGRDASGLFPSVVKNVVCQNIEVKKLVYVYLVRYAEEQQDLALLSISTFQRALKDPNQLIRASALRVLSSIRVNVIVPIMFLAIKDAVSDMSPYVRKTAAHAIPKLHALDPEQKDALVDVIERLLGDKTTLVVGSAVMAFEEVCPERIELIHRNYRKLCNLLVDVEEWGQVVIILMLTRYARTQFLDPNLSDVQPANGTAEHELPLDKKEPIAIDPDLRLLLRNCKPLLQSRNSAVVMAVCQLYYHLAPSSELNITTKALIRLLRSHREIQTVVLSNIATMSSMSASRKTMFEPHLKSFYVRTSDPTHIKVLKLEVLANLATETNISVVLREFQTYLQSTDMEFVQATIHCIGRVAHQIKEVADACLKGLTALLSSRNELVVAESVVVIKKLLQIESGQHNQIIRQMARLLDKIQVPMARASILWLIAEYAEPKIAPDVLRKIAKTFCQEEDIVKLQALNLASRLSLTNSQPQTKLIVQYIFNLAKYDQNYDIRDRVRFLRHLCSGNEAGTGLGRFAKKFLLASKPAPKLQSPFGGREQYQMGSLSHLINQPAAGYQELPDFPDEAPDPSVRDVTPPPTPVLTRHENRKSSKFYEDSDEEARDSSGNGSSDSSASSSSDSESDSETDSESDDSQVDGNDSNESNEEDAKPKSKHQSNGSESLSESTDDSDILRKARNLNSAKNHRNSIKGGDALRNGNNNNEKNLRNNHLSKNTTSKKIIPSDHDEVGDNNDDEEDDDDDDSSSSREDDDEEDSRQEQTKQKPQSVDLLLDLDDLEQNIPAPTLPLPMIQQTLSTITPSVKEPARIVTPVTNAVMPVLERQMLVSVQDWNGLEVLYRYTRCENIYSPKMTSLEFTFENKTNRVFEKIAIRPADGIAIEVKAAESHVALNPELSLVTTIGVDFKDSAQEVRLVLTADGASFEVRVTPPVGEIIRPVIVSQNDFEHFKKTLGGMCESSTEVSCALSPEQLREHVQRKLNVIVVEDNNVESVVSDSGKVRFAAQTMSSQCLVLIAIERSSPEGLRIIVNCERMVVGKMLLTQIKKVLQEAG
ncbi:AP-3 complex subunit beta-1 [Galendromus occidentalis]|uniref:AP-3 complex subunit beta n=1 Tax=Galendromus occidentalis TaxID=34638 RepID=A0AAJ7SFV3_9ACAR|nr:AP-3 complex subunit beta-1 [Galendromus occidentalis]